MKKTRSEKHIENSHLILTGWFACKCEFSRIKTLFYCTRCHSWAKEERKAAEVKEVANWKRIDQILQSAERTVLDGITVSHTLTTPQFIELQHLLQDARYESEAAEAMTTWQSMATAPRDGTEVLLRVERRAGIAGAMLVGHYMPGGHCIGDHPPIAEGWYFWSGCMFDKASKPTHWMLLPDAAEAEGGE